MHEQIAINCPFCHHKGAYRDAPSGSTVRCHECESIFRVPASHHRKPGEVLTGEQISRGTGKLVFIIVLILVIVGALGYLGYSLYKQHTAATAMSEDPFYDVPNIGPVTEHYGVLNRFMESWKAGKKEYMLKYCIAAERKDPNTESWMQNQFLDYRLTGYKLEKCIPASGFVEFKVIIECKEVKTDLPRAGKIEPKLYRETGDDGKEAWGVDMHSAVPVWD